GVSTWIQNALGQKTAGQAVIPGSLPLAVGGRVICRSHRGVQTFDSKTGELLWETRCLGGLDIVARKPNEYVHLSNWMNAYLPNHGQVLWENSVLGMLSSDGVRVYAVDDLAVPPYPKNTYGLQTAGQNLQLTQAAEL